MRRDSRSDTGDGLVDGKDADHASAASASGGKVRTFEVHALGPSGAGKTVFMASLYKRLNIKRPGLPFFLKSDFDTGLQLNHTYNEIANPDEKWPLGTQQVMEWSFTACVPTPAGDFEPIRYTYLDYPGGGSCPRTWCRRRSSASASGMFYMASVSACGVTSSRSPSMTWTRALARLSADM